MVSRTRDLFVLSCKSTGGESLGETVDSFTFLDNVSYSLYENLCGFLQNLLGEISARMDSQILNEFLALGQYCLSKWNLPIKIIGTTDPNYKTLYNV